MVDVVSDRDPISAVGLIRAEGPKSVKVSNVVLIGGGLAVTCAHCLEDKEPGERLPGPFKVSLPGFDETILAIPIEEAFRPDGVDLALLRLQTQDDHLLALKAMRDFEDVELDVDYIVMPRCPDTEREVPFSASAPVGRRENEIDRKVPMDRAAGAPKIDAGYSGGPIYRRADGAHFLCGIISSVSKAGASRFHIVPASAIRDAIDLVAPPVKPSTGRPARPVARSWSRYPPLGGRLLLIRGQAQTDETPDAMDLMLFLEATGHQRMPIQDHEVTFAISSLMVDLHHPDHAVTRTWPSAGPEKIHGEYPRSVMGVPSGDPDVTSFSVEANGEAKVLRGPVIGDDPDSPMRIARAVKRSDEPGQVTAKAVIEKLDIDVRDADGYELSNNERTEALKTILAKLVEKHRGDIEEHFEIDLTPARDQDD